MRAILVATSLLLTALSLALPAASAWGCENFAPGEPHAVCQLVLHGDGSEVDQEVDGAVDDVNDAIDAVQCVTDHSRC